jgi:hypothetical protein
MHAFTVSDLFELGERVLMVITDKTWRTLPIDLALKIGDPLEFRQAGRAVLNSFVAGIDGGWPSSPFAILLPSAVTKQEVPIGAEIWVSSASIRSA